MEKIKICSICYQESNTLFSIYSKKVCRKCLDEIELRIKNKTGKTNVTGIIYKLIEEKSNGTTKFLLNKLPNNLAILLMDTAKNENRTITGIILDAIAVYYYILSNDIIPVKHSKERLSALRQVKQDNEEGYTREIFIE